MTIVLIDQHPVLRKGMALFLEKSFANLKIIQCDSLTHFYESYKEENPHLIILGQAENGSVIDLNLIKTIRRRRPDSEMMIYSGDLQYHAAIAGLASGVKGYMLKNNSLEEFLMCINSVLDGKRYICREIMNTLVDERLDLATQEHMYSSLTDVEYTIADYLVKGFETNEIAMKIGHTESTVSYSKSNIFKKMGVKDVIHLKNVMLPTWV